MRGGHRRKDFMWPQEVECHQKRMFIQKVVFCLIQLLGRTNNYDSIEHECDYYDLEHFQGRHFFCARQHRKISMVLLLRV